MILIGRREPFWPLVFSPLALPGELLTAILPEFVYQNIVGGAIKQLQVDYNM